MSKQPSIDCRFSSGYVVWDVPYLEGRLLTIIDSLGFEERQDKAVKDLVRQVTREIYNLYYITGEDLTFIDDKNKKEGKGRHTPIQ